MSGERSLPRIARGVLLAVAALGLGALAMVATRYGVQPGRAGLAYYAIAVGVVAYGVLGARAPDASRISAALLAVVSIGSAVGAELLVEYTQWRRVARIAEAVAVYTGVPRDERSVSAVIKEARSAGEDLVPSVQPRNLLDYADGSPTSPQAFTAATLPLSGVTSRQTLLLCNEDGRYHRFLSDRYGFNNVDSAWEGGAPQLVLIGDSFTQGFCVAQDETIAAALRRRWPRTISLGAGGSGPLAELGALTEYNGVAPAPVVLWLYYENDLEDLARERGHPILRAYRDSGGGQRLAERRVETDSLLVDWIERTYHSADPSDPLVERPSIRRVTRFRGIRGLLPTVLDRPPTDFVDQLPLFGEVIGVARDRVRARNGTLVFVFLPEWLRLYRPEALPADRRRTEVLAAVRAAGVPVVDLTPAFAAVPVRDSLFAKGPIAPAHYSAAGYAFGARHISLALDSLGLGDVLDGMRPAPTRSSRTP